jgi:hypothetical protein
MSSPGSLYFIDTTNPGAPAVYSASPAQQATNGDFYQGRYFYIGAPTGVHVESNSDGEFSVYRATFRADGTAISIVELYPRFISGKRLATGAFGFGDTAINSTTGIMYISWGRGSTQEFASFDLNTGNFVTISSTGVSRGQLGISGGTLYSSREGVLRAIDTATGDVLSTDYLSVTGARFADFAGDGCQQV